MTHKTDNGAGLGYEGLERKGLYCAKDLGDEIVAVGPVEPGVSAWDLALLRLRGLAGQIGEGLLVIHEVRTGLQASNLAQSLTLCSYASRWQKKERKVLRMTWLLCELTDSRKKLMFIYQIGSDK